MFPIRDHNPSGRMPFVTWALIAANVLIFISYWPALTSEVQAERFFMAWAQVWRTKFREAALRRQLQTGPHSPGMYRILGVVRNFDEWYKAFNVQPGDKMYLPPEQRIRIW